MMSMIYLFWAWFRSYVSWCISIIFLILIIYFISWSWQDRRVTIEGHEYIERPFYHNTELIHNPECKKCKK